MVVKENEMHLISHYYRKYKNIDKQAEQVITIYQEQECVLQMLWALFSPLWLLQMFHLW